MASAPKTIAEFQQLARDKGLPLQKMRFFLGEDCKEPKCFGVYHDPEIDRYIVYKNKADGSRSVRYAGPDEQEACRILYDKLADEIQLRRDKKANAAAGAVDAAGYSRGRKTQKRPIWSNVVSCLLMIAIFVGAIWYAVKQPNEGYYHRNSEVYYYCNDAWYWFDRGTWVLTGALEGDWEDYWYGKTDEQFDADTCFEATSYYEAARNAHDSDSWSSSDFSDWSSSDTDWSSDW